MLCHDRRTGSKTELVGKGQDRILGFKHGRGILVQVSQKPKGPGRLDFYRPAYGVKCDSKVRVEFGSSGSAAMHTILLLNDINSMISQNNHFLTHDLDSSALLYFNFSTSLFFDYTTNAG